MGFNMHFYIIFGTNLLTGGLVPVFFAYFSVSQKRNIKRNETFARIFLGTNANQETWSWSLELREASTRQEGVPKGGRSAPTLEGPTELHRRTSFAYIYSYTLNIRGCHETTFPPPQPSVPVRSHMRPFPAIFWRGIRSWRASTSTP